MSTSLGMPTVRPPVSPHGVGALSGDRGFPAAAKDALANEQLRRNLGNATRTIRTKRAKVVAEVPDWAELRAAGAAIKDDVLAHLDTYLIQLEEQVTARGASCTGPGTRPRPTGSSPNWSGPPA